MKQNLDAIAILALIMQVLAIQAANLPPLSQLATSYEAERTTSGVMFDLEAKKDLVIYGIDINTIYNSPARLEMWIKEGSYKGFEKDANAWTNIFNSTVNGNGMGVPTPIPTGFFGPIVLKANETRSLYIAYPQGANLRYLTGTEEGLPAASNDDLVIYEGIARRVGFDSAIYSPRVYSGALNYMVGSPPTAAPTAVPTQKPTTAGPTHAPTIRPTALPTTVESRFNTFATSFDSSTTSAGTMFDIKTKDRDIMIHTLGFNTYKKTDISIEVWTREGTYSSFEKDISGWTKLVNMTLEGQGLDVPTILPYGSFDPIAIRRDTRQAFYIRTTGPFIRYSDGVAEGQVVSSNEDIILFEGAGKRKEITGATMSPRVWNGVIKYETIVMPTPAPVTNAPTRDLNGLELATTTYYPIHDTYIQKGVTASQSGKVQLLVDGAPKRVSLFHFDISNINGANAITKAVFRVYALTDSLKGGDFSVIQDGYIDDSSNWDNVIYGDFEGFKVGSLGPVTAKTYYEIDITDAFMDRIPTTFILRVGSDNADGVMYRSSASAVNNGPMLTIEFATQPNSSVMHEVFGTESPTSAPTSERVWPDLRTPSNPPSRYFNYNPNSRYGPDNWGRISHDRFWSQYEGLDSDLSDNRCSRGKRQSPRNLCRTSDECLEFHQPRPRRGEYGFIGSSTPKPTPYIFHNKLRASYKERKDEEEKPEPPGVDFARNGSTGPDVQDLVNLDIKIKSEHRLCNKQYDAEMQLYFLHYKGNLEAMAILIEADGPRNDHFQQLIDFFQEKYDDDKRQCERRKRRARALLSSDSASNDNLLSSKLFRGSSGEFEKTQVDAKEGDTFYRRLQGKFLSLVTRQTARTWRWDPLMPGDIWKSIHYWSYSGSTTEPPCFEGVRWRVIDVPMKISPGQYEQLKKIQFGHVDPDTCRRTSTHYDQSNARPVQSYRGGAYYRCRRSDYVSDKERAASGKRRGFNDKKDWRGVGLLPWVEGEFPNV